MRIRNRRRRSLRVHSPQQAVEEQHRSRGALRRFVDAVGVVRRRRRERRNFVVAGGIELGRAGAGFPDEGDGARNVAVVDSEGGFGGFAGEKLREDFVVVGFDSERFLVEIVAVDRRHFGVDEFFFFFFFE